MLIFWVVLYSMLKITNTLRLSFLTRKTVYLSREKFKSWIFYPVASLLNAISRGGCQCNRAVTILASTSNDTNMKKYVHIYTHRRTNIWHKEASHAHTQAIEDQLQLLSKYRYGRDIYRNFATSPTVSYNIGEYLILLIYISQSVVNVFYFGRQFLYYK